MGGWGSGRSGGGPVKEDGFTIDLAMMLRKGWMRDGFQGWSRQLTWSRGDKVRGSISYDFDMTEPDNASLTLHWRTREHGGEWQERRQHIRLVYTCPRFGGRRWWMVCPVRGDRIGKLYMPAGTSRFAGRKAWGIAYRSQRVARSDRAFEKLYRLQRKLGNPEQWEGGLRRPKGMWHRTYERHFERYLELDGECAVTMMAVIGALRAQIKMR